MLLLFTSLNTQNSSSSILESLSDVIVFTWTSTKQDTSVTNIEMTIMLIELTISLVYSTVDNPNCISFIPLISSSSSKLTSISCRILNLNGIFRFTFFNNLAIFISENIMIPDRSVVIVNIELTFTVVLIVFHYETSFEGSHRSTIFVHEPFEWFSSTSHFVSI